MILAALITTIISVFVQLYLTVQHYQLRLGLAEGPSACHINATFNCDAVAVSSYSVFAGVPVAIWGAWTNIALSLLLLFAVINLLSDRERVLRYAGWLALFTAVVSVVMALISKFALNTFCLYCMGAYALSFLALFFLWRATGFVRGPLAEDSAELFKSHRWILWVLLLIPAGSYLSKAIIDQSYGVSQLEQLSQESLANWKNAAPQEFDLQNGLPLQKSDKTPVMTIVEFADFMCSHCKSAAPTLHTFTDGRDDVRLVFKTFPLDGTCNKAITQKGDGLRCRLAAAVFCAEKISQKGWSMHQRVFENQENFYQVGQADQILTRIMGELGIDPTALKTCTESNEILDQIEKQAAEGERAKIQGTPAIFVNGKVLNRGQAIPILEAVYQDLKASNK